MGVAISSLVVMLKLRSKISKEWLLGCGIKCKIFLAKEMSDIRMAHLRCLYGLIRCLSLLN